MVIYSDTVIKIITSFLILILGLVLANVLSNILRKVLKEAEINKILAKQFKIKISVENYLVNIFKYLIYFINIVKPVSNFFILRIIFLVIVIIVIVFIVLAFKDWIPNLVSGFYIYKTQKIKTGDTIIMNGLTGKVKRINLIETKIITKNNEVIFIPNSNITKYEIVKK